MPNDNWLSRLEELAPPPSRDFTYDWGSVEAELNTALPSDYKSLLQSYGPGTLGGFISLYIPHDNNQAIDLFSRTHAAQDALRCLTRDLEELTFGIRSVDELMPWGVTDNGDWCYWILHGDPDRWVVALNAARDPEWDKFEMGITEFLFKILPGSITTTIFPEDFPGDDVGFLPSGWHGR